VTRRAPRLPLAFLGGLALAVSLFWLLHALVGARVEVTHAEPARRIEFSRLQRDTESQPKPREPKPALERATDVPAAPALARVGLAPSPAGVPVFAPSLDVRGSLSGLPRLTAGSDQDAVPLVRIDPEFPARAAARKVQGWVVVRYTITAAGTVTDAAVVKAEPEGWFEEAALRAISRWKFSPKFENGAAVERRGMQVQLNFTLRKE